jgi:hypothetical protein
MLTNVASLLAANRRALKPYAFSMTILPVRACRGKCDNGQNDAKVMNWLLFLFCDGASVFPVNGVDMRLGKPT